MDAETNEQLLQLAQDEVCGSVLERCESRVLPMVMFCSYFVCNIGTCKACFIAEFILNVLLLFIVDHNSRSNCPKYPCSQDNC